MFLVFVLNLSELLSFDNGISRSDCHVPGRYIQGLFREEVETAEEEEQKVNESFIRFFVRVWVLFKNFDHDFSRSENLRGGEEETMAII